MRATFFAPTFLATSYSSSAGPKNQDRDADLNWVEPVGLYGRAGQNRSGGVTFL